MLDATRAELEALFADSNRAFGEWLLKGPEGEQPLTIAGMNRELCL